MPTLHEKHMLANRIKAELRIYTAAFRAKAILLNKEPKVTRHIKRLNIFNF